MARVAALAACVVAVAVIGACGGDESPNDSPARESPPANSHQDEERDETVDRVDHGSRDPDRFRAEAEESFARAAESAPGEGSSLEQAQAELPVREPPLPIQQYILADGSHDVVARPDLRDFFCIGGPVARRAAIEAYFDRAEETFKRHGIDDFSLTIALNSDTIDDFKVLARASRARGIKLTKRGRADRC